MEHSAPKLMLRALLGGYLLTALLLAAATLALYRLRLGESQVKMAVSLIYLLSCALSGFLMGKGLGRRRFFCGFLAGLFYFLILASVSAIVNNGLTSDTPRFLTALILCGAGGILGGVLS